ncbi:MAG: hypoxanthine-guanine phosphoribosyltransferase [Thiobacillaceae bacterium]|nr:hypoxanthine-guanine phosphoribosyltransferase [Thiobacillaceae bacterium]MCX7672524.1 hypoxanthine-guanine phosphoribosyltransferase [Thiobacillaceae bacterium]MDW8324743.1 hypoxanthine-guanine phosphoribosyltransferase [Burkholderiales bacterium]
MYDRDIERAWALFNQAELLYSRSEVEAALDRLAQQISAALADRFPVALCVMGGAVVFAGQLLPRLEFPLEFDYLHATRYREGTRGGEIDWPVLPRKDLHGRTVLLLDDILDEGHTLQAARVKLAELGAAEVRIAVLAEKDLGRPKPIQADFVGLRLPDRYVFGMGMDAYGLWRNLPAIYALKEEV